MLRKLLIALICITFYSCEKYVTESSTLTLDGKYVLSKLTVLETSQPISHDTTYLSGQIFINKSLPHPFDTLKVDNFYIHFTYSNIRMVWYNRIQNGQRDRWEYGESPNEIFYYRVPWSYDAYNFGKIEFLYKPKDRGTFQKIIFQIDSDLLESIQLSGLEFAPFGKDGPHYRLVMSFNRVGP